MQNEKKVLKNIRIRQSWMKTPFDSKDVGKQYSCILEGTGLDDLGLRETNQKDGFWYSNNAVYGNTGRIVPPIQSRDMSNQEITEEFGDGTTAHILFEAEPFEAGINQRGVAYPAGINWIMKALRIVDFKKTHTAFDDMDALLLADGLSDFDAIDAAEETSDTPF